MLGHARPDRLDSSALGRCRCVAKAVDLHEKASWIMCMVISLNIMAYVQMNKFKLEHNLCFNSYESAAAIYRPLSNIVTRS